MALPVIGSFGFTIGILLLLIIASAWILRARPSAALYHVLVFLTFFVVYLTIPGGFRKHFNVPDKTSASSLDVGYYTAVTHTGVGYGDIYPVSTPARMLVSVHILLVVLAVFNVLPFAVTTSI